MGTPATVDNSERSSFTLVKWKVTEAEGALRHLTVSIPARPENALPVGNQRPPNAIQLVEGSVEVDDCDISSLGGTGVDGKPDSQGLNVHHSNIHNCGVAGVSVACRTGSVHHCNISNNMDGLMLWRAGSGDDGGIDIYENEMNDNQGSGIGVHSESKATVRENVVRKSG